MQLKCNVVLHLGAIFRVTKVDRQTWNLKAKLGILKYDFRNKTEKVIFYENNTYSLCGIIIVLHLSDSNIQLSMIPNALSNLT